MALPRDLCKILSINRWPLMFYVSSADVGAHGWGWGSWEPPQHFLWFKPPHCNCRKAFWSQMAWRKLSAAEIALANKLHAEKGMSAAKIAELLGRAPSTISRLVVEKVPRKRQGRKPMLSNAMLDKLEAKLETMIQKADSQKEVTVTMLRRSTRCKASERTILRELHKRGINFRPLRQKPVLTEEDISDRLAFAEKFAGRSKAWWNSSIHMIIDIKHFRVLPHGSARRYAAQESTRGIYRKKGQGLCKPKTHPTVP